MSNNSKTIVISSDDAIKKYGFDSTNDFKEETKLVLDYIGTVTIKDYTKCRYEYVGEFCEGLARVRNFQHSWGYIDHTGKEVIPCVYTMAGDFSEGLGAVRTDGQWMFLDKNGNVKIKCSKTFKEVYPFHNGRARVHNGIFYGYIDRSGKEVIPCNFYEADDFDNGFAIVSKKRPSFVMCSVAHAWVRPLCRIIDVDGNTYTYFPEEAKRIKKMSTTIKSASDEKERLNLKNNCVDYASDITLLGRTISLTSKTKLELIERKKELLENMKTLIHWLEKDIEENEKIVEYQKNYNRSYKAKTNQ